MRRLMLITLIAGSIVAQPFNQPQWIAPGVSHSEIDSFLDFTTNPVLMGLTTHPRPIFGCNISKMPSDPPGQWTLSFTLRALQGYGNPVPGYSGFVMAEWQPAANPPLVLVHYADAVNDSFVDYNLNLEPITYENGVRTGGRYGVFDRFGPPPGLAYQGVFLASRSDDRAPFGAPVPVANLQGTNGFADPALGYVDGQLKIFYAGIGVNSGGLPVEGILMDDLLGAGTASPQAAGNPVLVSQPIDRQGMPSYSCHSPSPVHGHDGEAKGLMVAEGDGADRSDIYFAADLDPDTPQVLFVDNTSWLSSGGSAGGIAIFTQRETSAGSGVAPQAPRVVHGSWITGDEVGVGEIAHITVRAYSEPLGPTALTRVFLGPFWLSSPISFPNVYGQLGVTPLARLPLKLIPDADQTATFHKWIPPIPWLVGADIPLQSLTTYFDGTSGLVRTLTNTATIRVR